MTKTDSDHIASVNLNHGLSMEIMGGKHVYIQLLKCTRQDGISQAILKYT